MFVPIFCPFSNRIFKINLFIFYFWLHWVFVAACRLSLVAVSGGYSSLWCAGFSLQWLLLLWSTGSMHADFSSCGTRAQQLWLTGSRVQAQQLWCMGLAALKHVGSSQTRARTCVPCTGRQIPNHCAIREVPLIGFFFNIMFQEFFIHSRYKSFARYVVCKYYLPTCNQSFHLLNVVFHRAKVFNFDEVQFINFSFDTLGLVAHLKILCLVLGPEDFISIFFLEVLILCFTFKPRSIFFYWSILGLQCCVSFRCMAK